MLRCLVVSLVGLLSTAASAAPQACLSPWGGDLIYSGSKIVAFETPRPPLTGACKSEIRECQGGFLTGSFQYPSCKKAAPTPGYPIF